MRTIKFRGKSKATGDWLYGDVLRNTEGAFAVVSPFEINCHNECSTKEVDEKTIGQFTGLHDCNGKEIYEGDILHVKLYRNAFMNETKEFRDAFDVDDLKGELMEEFTSPVEFTECSFGIRDFYLDSFWKDPKHCYPIHDIKVIGNIHDNPKLVKGGEE